MIVIVWSAAGTPDIFTVAVAPAPPPIVNSLLASVSTNFAVYVFDVPAVSVMIIVSSTVGTSVNVTVEVAAAVLYATSCVSPALSV